MRISRRLAKPASSYCGNSPELRVEIKFCQAQMSAAQTTWLRQCCNIKNWTSQGARRQAYEPVFENQDLRCALVGSMSHWSTRLVFSGIVPMITSKRRLRPISCTSRVFFSTSIHCSEAGHQRHRARYDRLLVPEGRYQSQGRTCPE